ncbi:MAG TPA: methyltransferase domain-containing protein [Acidimicrobiales bacterium]
MSDGDALAGHLQAHYGAAARRAAESAAAGAPCCGPAADDCCAPGAVAAPADLQTADRDGAGDGEVFGAGVYGRTDLENLPEAAIAGSIGCANPVALARLEPGEDVLDLGSGGGIDVLLSARRVAPGGRAYGVDMTPEMLELARRNQARAGVVNAEFLEGRIEAVPLPDASVDVVVSNCVVNLSADKGAVFAEAFRVLRPGGRLALADVVADREPDPSLRDDLDAWAGCLAGAITRPRYRRHLLDAGFAAPEIVDSHPVAEGLWSVLVRATKPASA